MAFALRPFIGWCVQDIEGPEALRVLVLKLLEFVFQKDVFLRYVPEDEGDFCFVGGVLEDCADELVHPV